MLGTVHSIATPVSFGDDVDHLSLSGPRAVTVLTQANGDLSGLIVEVVELRLGHEKNHPRPHMYYSPAWRYGSRGGKAKMILKSRRAASEIFR